MNTPNGLPLPYLNSDDIDYLTTNNLKEDNLYLSLFGY